MLAKRTYIFLDMLEVGCCLECLMIPVHAFQPVVEDGIGTPDRSKITLEVLYVDGIEPDKRDVQSHIELSHLLPQDIGTFAFVH